MKDVPERIYPFGRDLRDFVRGVRKHVTDYVHVYYPDGDSMRRDHELMVFWKHLRREGDSHTVPPPTRETLCSVLGDLIVHTTGLHNQVGNVADYLVNPSFASAKIRKGREVADVQASFQGLNIGLMTGNLMPKLINNFTHLLLQDEHLEETTKVFNEFQADLRKLVLKIDERNKERRFPCNAM